MLTLFFTPGPVTDYATARASDLERFGAFFRASLDGGCTSRPRSSRPGSCRSHHGREIEQVVAAAEAFFSAG